MKRAWGALLGLALAPNALMAENADESAMFGGESVTVTPELRGPATSTEAAGPGTSVQALESLLQIGGTLYQRLDLRYQRGLTEGEIPLSLPLQIDTFLDGRPNDRVRAYIGARLLYDSSLDAYSNPTSGRRLTLPSATAVTGAAALPNNPQVVLDQAWLKFDLGRTVFVSLGKQHVKWGSARIWNPSDQLNPQRRDPLQPYDLRLGNSLLKLQIPFEKSQTNVYALALFDNPQPASTLQQAGGAARIETVLWGAEIGVDAITRPGRQPAYGADISGPLGPFDAYAEAAILTGDDLVNYQFKAKPTLGSSFASIYAVNALPGHALQASAGLDYTFAWLPSRSATLGLEYFYNELGVDDGALNPILIFLGKYQPFYVGKHYGALFIRAEGPDAGRKTSYSFSTLSNVTDGSYVSRLDFNWLLQENLTFGMNGSAHYGNKGGEFNFALSTPALVFGSSVIPPIDVPESPWEAGASLRLSF